MSILRHTPEPPAQEREVTALSWKRVKGDAISADLSCAGPYVISHRSGEHTLSYRPPGEHHCIGVFATEDAAKEAASLHGEVPPRPQRRSLIADVERELRGAAIPCVAIKEVSKALFGKTSLKRFHFVVYDKQDDNWLLWCGEPTAAVRREMNQWAAVFGEGYQVVYAVRRKCGILYKAASGKHLTLGGEEAPQIPPIDDKHSPCGE